MKCFVLLTMLVLASKNENDVENVAANSEAKIGENAAENSIVVKIEEDEYVKKKSKSSDYIGVSYHERARSWAVQRWSKNEKKMVVNGYYKDEETAAHASDTLARKLMANDERDLKLNFPEDNTEVYPKEKKTSSKFIGVTYHQKPKKWCAYRWSTRDKKRISYGTYKHEETAAHASDTLARKLMANNEQGHKLNFPDDNTEVHPEEKKTSSEFIGVIYDERTRKWVAKRWSKTEKKHFTNGYHKYEETAAHASDTLVRKLMANGEQGHKLNFTDDSTEEQPKQQNNKRKRSFDFEDSQTDENNFEKFEEKENRKQYKIYSLCRQSIQER